ncbi:MAG: hypothetical protein JSV96_01420 [Candidatus Aminicenantes bacterium]|nr:MAG: hypothetical protein JSV96_01420 [Candidatus Aminicenantes bacterium]
MLRKSILIFVLFIFASCGTVVIVPPEIDLSPQERIGLISFSIENAEGNLDVMATQRFLQVMTTYQNVQVIELGSLEAVLEKINKKTLDQEAIRAIGDHFEVNSFFYGKINVSDVKPMVDIGALIHRLQVRATFTISMTSRLFSTETGATLWTDSADRKETLAYMSMAKDRVPYFDVRDEEDAYKGLTERLVLDLTRDFRPTKRRVK